MSTEAARCARTTPHHFSCGEYADTVPWYMLPSSNIFSTLVSENGRVPDELACTYVRETSRSFAQQRISDPTRGTHLRPAYLRPQSMGNPFSLSFPVAPFPPFLSSIIATVREKTARRWDRNRSPHPSGHTYTPTELLQRSASFSRLRSVQVSSSGGHDLGDWRNQGETSALTHDDIYQRH